MANAYGNSNLPVVQKTTIVIQKGLKTKTIETAHDSASVPVPTIGSIVSGLKIISYSNEPIGTGLIKQTVVYEGSDSDSTPSIPATTYESQGSMVEVDIRQHEDWATTFVSDWDNEKGEFKPDSEFFGITSFIMGSVTVTKSEYFSSNPSDRYADIGTLEVPGGGYSGTGHWLIIGTGRSKVGEGLYCRQTTYLYSSKAYNTLIYS